MSTKGHKLLEKAISDFKSSLKPEDEQSLSRIPNPNAEDVVKLVTDIDFKLQTKQKRRKLQDSAFMDFIKSIQQFSSIVDVTVQSNPEIASLVWGGIKFVLIIFLNHSKYLEEITDNCEKMGRLCPQYDRFSKLFSTHLELQSCICEFYAIVVNFFREALRFLYKSGFKQFAIATFNPFEEKFGDTLKSLALIKETVEREIYLASENELHLERIDATRARTDANDFYNLARANFQAYQDDRIQLNHAARRSRRERILENISDYPYHFDFTDNLSKRQDNTGQWIFNTPEYESWLQLPKSSGLWYHAIPGFGKSVLTAGVIDNLMELSRTASTKHYISYFFCTYTSPTSLQARTILASLLRQLAYYSHIWPQDLSDSFESYFEDKENASRVVPSNIQALLIKLIKANKARNFIIIDGLDECNDKDRGLVVRTLKQIFSSIPDDLKILISSRASQDIGRALNEFKQLDLATSNQSDIEAFITRTLQDKEMEGQLPDLEPRLIEKIKTTLAANAQGLFVWVDLQIAEICNESSPETIENALLPANLPKDLNELYTRILRRIARFRRPEIAVGIFKWVAYAVRPLALAELKEVMAMTPDITSWAQLSQKAEVDESKWIQNCENLVTINKQTKTVRFVHYTIKEFLASEQLRKDPHLEETFSLSPQRDQSFLADVCLQYVELTDIKNQGLESHDTGIPRKEAAALGMLPSIITEPGSSLIGWLAKKVQKPPKRESDTGASSLVLVKSQNAQTISMLQKPSFKRMLQKHLFLEYATTNLIIHYDVLSRNLLPEDDEPTSPLSQMLNTGTAKCRTVLTLLSSGTESVTRLFYPLATDSLEDLLTTKWDTIRFPWQNHLISGTDVTDEDNCRFLDWALKNNVHLFFRMFYKRLFSTQSKFLIEYWFRRSPDYNSNLDLIVTERVRSDPSTSQTSSAGIHPIEYHADGTLLSRFERLCLNNEAFHNLWQFPLLSYHFSSKGTKYPFQDEILTMLPHACESGDHVMLAFLMEFWVHTKQKGFKSTAKYNKSQIVDDMFLGALAADSILVMEQILHNTDFKEYFDSEISESLFPTNFIHVPSKGTVQMLKYLLATWFNPFKECDFTRMEYKRIGSDLFLEAVKTQNTEMVAACLEMLDGENLEYYYGDNMAPTFIDRAILLAATLNHLEIFNLLVELLMRFLSKSITLKSVTDDGVYGKRKKLRVTALCAAIKNKNVDMVGSMLDIGCPFGTVYDSVSTNPDGTKQLERMSPGSQFTTTPSVRVAKLLITRYEERFLLSLALDKKVTGYEGIVVKSSDVSENLFKPSGEPSEEKERIEVLRLLLAQMNSRWPGSEHVGFKTKLKDAIANSTV
ncbi:hypothetical protein TWF694_000776 [Orbilia ellipsospora]|uniref:NACHT domain-containing protein n=1 Tax=Orbilia ellipsospora TaxID=2528407 RepID=A0AAV9XS79_9PEZI